MAQTITPPLPEELQLKVDEIAREQNREPAEVLEEAVRRYVGIQALERLSPQLEKRARAKGIREEDVHALVKENRRENQTRGR